MFPRLPYFKIVIITLFVTAFISGAAAAEQQRYGGALVYGNMGDPLDLDPGVINDPESEQIASAIFETLVKYDPANDGFVPVLATSWDTASNYRIWVFHLRKGVKFHDGYPLNAGSVKFSWERQMHTSHPFHNPPYGRFTFYKSVWGGFPGNIKDIKIIDDYTVQVTLYSRDYRFLRTISNIPFAIVSPHAVSERGKDFTKRPVGTGPFRFADWRKWQRILLESNPNYWGNRPYIDRLIFASTSGEVTRFRQMCRGNIDVMKNPNKDLILEIESGKTGNMKLQPVPGANFSYISLNCQKPPLDSATVRKAIHYAINKDALRKKIFENLAPVSSPFNSLWGQKTGAKTYPYNPAVAKALLKKAGYPNGFPLELWFLKIPTASFVNSEIAANEIARQLEKVGIQVTVKGVRWDNYIEKLRFGNHQAAIMSCEGITYDPDLYFQITWSRINAALGGTNFSFYRNEKIFNLLAGIKFSPDTKKRADAYRQIQRIIAEDSPIIPLFSNRSFLVINNRVKGVIAKKNGIIDFSRAWINK